MIGFVLAALLAAAGEESLTPLARVLAAAGPPAASSGVVRPSETLLRAPVRHGVTGVLKQEVRSRGLLSMSKPVPAGAPVFATSLNDQIVWCAPSSQARRDGRREWSAVCFPGGSSPMWATAGGGLFVGRVVTNEHTNMATAVEVEEKPVDFGEPMQLTFEFGGWRHDEALVDVWVRWAGGRAYLARRALPREADGSARLNALGGQLRLRPGADRKAAQVEVLLPPRDDVAPLESF